MEVDLAAVRANVRAVRRVLGPEVRLVAVVKADGYGHGAVAVARASLDVGAESLAVTYLEEALPLRRAGLKAPLLVMGPVDPRDAGEAAGHRLSVMVDNLPLARALSHRGTSRRPIDVHVKVRGGLHRWGVPLQDLTAFLKQLRRLPHLRCAGIFAHPGYMAGKNGPAVERWLSEWEDRLRSERAADPHLRVHVADSAVLLDFPQFRYRDVRVGNLLYGINPTDKPLPLKNPWRPVTRLVRVVSVSAGTSIGYGGVFQADRAMTLGVLPVGYGHGFTLEPASPVGSKGYWVTVRGQRCPVVGRVGMSHTVVDVSVVSRPRRDEKVFLPLRRTASAVWEKIYRG